MYWAECENCIDSFAGVDLQLPEFTVCGKGSQGLVQLPLHVEKMLP